MKDILEVGTSVAGTDSRIDRTPVRAAARGYDLIVVGGGIYGVMIAAEATRRGAAVLLLEKDDFGGATSFNSLKTIHGGLRYLQTFSLVQHRHFVNERRWFLRHFPGLVQRLPVLMPLYRQGLRRPLALRAALLADHLLSLRRNAGLPLDRSIPRGRVVGPNDAERIFPLVRRQDLAGGAVWFDACMPDPQRLIMEVLRDACGRGLVALNYTAAAELLTEGGHVRGVRARDHEGNQSLDFTARTVVNAAGPWCREVGEAFDREYPELFEHSVAWNVLLDREALSDHALAVSPPQVHGRVYFIHPWKGRMLAGTGHAPRLHAAEKPEPTDAEIGAFLRDINNAVPKLQLSESDIQHVYSGYLPVKRAGTVDLTSKAAVLDHSREGGPAGLISVAGNKFTASRHTAERVMRHLGMERPGPESTYDSDDVARRLASTSFSFHSIPASLDRKTRDALLEIIRDEATVHLDDLVLRRTSLGDNPRRALTLAGEIADLFDWDPSRVISERQRVTSHFRWMNR